MKYRDYGIPDSVLPKPTLRPRIDWAWPFWRLYGHLIYVPSRRLIGKWQRTDFIKDPDHWNGGKWVRRHPSWDTFREWLWKTAPGKGLIHHPIKYRLEKFFNPCHQCPHCGDDTWLDDDDHLQVTAQGRSSTEDGTSYWFEGWRWCKRCGAREFVGDST